MGPAPRERGTVTTPTPTGAPINILVVDDESNIRKTLAICLEAEGHHVTAVSNFQDAVAEASRRTFHMAFVDLRLGTASGLDLIPVLLSGSPWMKIVVITAYASIDTAVEAMRRGATDYIPKPFTPAQVLLAVRKVEEVADAGAESGGPPGRPGENDPGGPVFERKPRHAARHGSGPAGRADRRRNAPSRRERDRENRPGPRDPRLEPALRETVRCCVVPLPSDGAPDERAVRPCERRVHRGDPRQPGAHRRLRGGDASFSTRSAISPLHCSPSCCGSCRTRNTSGSATRRRARPTSASSRPPIGTWKGR